jgi:hypothetical protein
MSKDPKYKAVQNKKRGGIKSICKSQACGLTGRLKAQSRFFWFDFIWYLVWPGQGRHSQQLAAGSHWQAGSPHDIESV